MEARVESRVPIDDMKKLQLKSASSYDELEKLLDN